MLGDRGDEALGDRFARLSDDDPVIHRGLRRRQNLGAAADGGHGLAVLDESVDMHSTSSKA